MENFLFRDIIFWANAFLKYQPYTIIVAISEITWSGSGRIGEPLTLGSGRNHNLPRTRKPGTLTLRQTPYFPFPTPSTSDLTRHPLSFSSILQASQQPPRFFLMYDSTYIFLTPFANTGALTWHIHIECEAYVRTCIQQHTHTLQQRGQRGRVRSTVYTCIVKNPWENSIAEDGRQCRAVMYRISKVTRPTTKQTFRFSCPSFVEFLRNEGGTKG